ncbi:putative Nudix hydrolase domain-containing protein [Seiridium cardinale]|uniref:Nudix hydrolase domain-containing protein n=1 Tax=Seiridium cardinale TaxID=138064 RepID=A0ABR2XF78_9PEZI
MEEQMTLEDWLDDLCVRFILNLPEEDLGSIPHICFQIEEAHWFYEDFIRVLDPALPHMSLKDFCLRMFQHCPLFANYSIEHHVRAYQEFMQYKTRIPVRGAIMLNHEMDSCVLVRGWKSNSTWSFPRGKINKDETDLDCAIRECWEETGFDVRKAGLVPADDDVKFFDITMRDQHLRMFVFRDVPMDTVFEPQTRNEIGKVAWYNLRDLPAFRKKKGGKQNEGNGAANAIPNASKFYNVAPFLVPLKKWVLGQKKKDIPPKVFQDDVFVNNSDIEELEAAIPQFQEASNRSFAATRESPRSLPNEGGGNNQGAALLSMLQSKEVAAAPFQNQYPHTPLDHITTHVSQPQSPHYHHQAQRLPYGAFENPPQFPIAPHSQNAYSSPQQYQARPQVHMTTDSSGRQNVMVSPRQYQTQPQLLHPQPQPPQVQQALLMRGMLSTPGGQAQQSRPGPVQGNLHIAHQHQQQQQLQQKQPPQPNPFNMASVDGGPRGQAQPSAHSMGLLNMFKDKPAQENAPQVLKPMPPTDKHRSGLLDMFKQGDQPTADTRSDLHLPFGALSIASRQPQPSQNTARMDTTRSPRYPYADPNRGVSAADMSIARVPDASALPRPNNILQPRRDSSQEQRTQLLSLFGKNKGKDPVASVSPVDMVRPRSRVASIASQSVSGSQTAGSRRGSHTPTSLTPADQSFLMNFLKNASKPQR